MSCLLRRCRSLSVLVLALVPAAVQASNGGHPRTPVDWSQVDVACRSVVDRSVDPVWHLEYGIPFEDTEVTADEVTDSRRHQFFALCHPLAPHEAMPNWISLADVESAAAKDLVDPAEVEPDEVLETNTEWDGCWVRLNGDDDRRPITFEAAAAGVDWDTTGVAPGTYSILGYTYEPAINLWVRRAGFVKVIDGGDPAAIGPSAAISTGELILQVGEAGVIEGCVDALPGAAMTAYYASTETEGGAAWDPQWVPFASDVAVEGESFSIAFDAPEELGGESAAIRIDVTDTEDRTYTTYMLDLIVVLPLTGGDDGCSGNGFIQGPDCGETGSATGAGTTGVLETTGDGSSSSATTSAQSDAGSDGAGSGCSCDVGSSQQRGRGALMLLALALPFMARRRRTARACSSPAGRR